MIEEFMHPFNNNRIPFVFSLGYQKKRQIKPLPQKFKWAMQRVTYVCNRCLLVWLSSACAPGRQRHNPAPPCVFGDGQPLAAPPHTLGHYSPKTEENEAQKSGGRFID